MPSLDPSGPDSGPRHPRSVLSLLRRGSVAFTTRLGAPGLLAIAVTALGLGLRIEHAITFDGPARGADYAVHVEGVRWILEHKRPFDFAETVSGQIRYQPPLWYALGAVILRVTGSERAIAALAVIGWAVRQLLLALLLRRAIPARPWSALAALAINAVLPLSVLTDGKVNPEGLHTTLFMVAVYWLWRMERESHEAGGISFRSAGLFGAFAGLAVLTKGTSGVLVLSAAIVLGARAVRLLAGPHTPAAWRRLVRPALVAACAWTVVAGWWCGPNLVKYGHPFPHSWDRSPPGDGADPIPYRRPLGWILPLDWKESLALPVIRTPTEPRPNFWAATVVGTWTDYYNRGFCRLKGGGTDDHVFWGGWAVSGNCIRLFRVLARIGVCLTLLSLGALAFLVWTTWRSDGRLGSLALPATISLSVLFVMLFALTYPYDNSAVLNPRYLMPIATPMAACLGIALGQIEGARRLRLVLHGIAFVGIAAVAILVVVERISR